MSSKQSAIEQLNTVVANTVANISGLINSSTAFTRNRKLNAETTIKTILNMQGNSLNSELMNAFPDKNSRMTASAFEQAKGKLTPEVFKYIFHDYNKTMEPKLFGGKYRLFAIDGSDFCTPYNANSAFVTTNGCKKKNGEDTKPFCQVHANIMFDVVNRTYEDCILQPKTLIHERKAAIEMIKNLDCGNYIVLMDRGYEGFNLFETCNRLEHCNYVIRTKANNGGIIEIRNLPDKECDIDIKAKITTNSRYYALHCNEEILHFINKPKKSYKCDKTTKYGDWDFEENCTVNFRVVKFRINEPNSGKEEWETIVTNLNRFEFPVEKIKELYHLRWDIETSFRELKYALGGINFHSKKDDFIEMELFAHLVMFNVVSRNIASVSVPKTERKHKYAIDFKMACEITRKFYKRWGEYSIEDMYEEIVSYTNPIRPGRADKRNMRPKSAVWFLYRVA